MDNDYKFVHTQYGYCYYSIESDGSALLYNLYIEPDDRRKGNARYLIDLVIKEIKRSGCFGPIRVEAIPRENSIDINTLSLFYRQMGLVIF